MQCSEEGSAAHAPAPTIPTDTPTRRRLSIDFLLNQSESGLAALHLRQPDGEREPAVEEMSEARGEEALPEYPIQQPTALSSESIHSLPPLSSVLSSPRPSSPSSGESYVPSRRWSLPSLGPDLPNPAHCQPLRRAGRSHRRSISAVVRPSAFVLPSESVNWANGAPERRPVVEVASSGPLVTPPRTPQRPQSNFFLPITALPVVLDADEPEFEYAGHSRRLGGHSPQQIRPSPSLLVPRQQRPRLYHSGPHQIRQNRVRYQRLTQSLGDCHSMELDQDEEEVARTLADTSNWADRGRNAKHRRALPEVVVPSTPAEPSPGGNQQDLLAEAQRLFRSHLQTTSILPASEAIDITRNHAAATHALHPPENETNRSTLEESGTLTSEGDTTSDIGNTNTNITVTAAPALTTPTIAPLRTSGYTYRSKAEAFQFTPDQQDLLQRLLERSQQKEAERATNGEKSDPYSSAERSRASQMQDDEDGERDDEGEGGPLSRVTKKRKRVSAQQLAVLEECFAIDPMPTTAVKLKLAETLNMSPKRVQIW